MYLWRVLVGNTPSPAPPLLSSERRPWATVGKSRLIELFSQRFKPLEGANVMPDTFVKLPRHLLQCHCCLQHGYYRETTGGCVIKESRVVNADTAEGVSWLTVLIDVTALQDEIAFGVVYGIGYQYQVRMVAFDGSKSCQGI